ncbi:MAG: ABC transporter substrate-binding protein [Faecousia sp.]
MKRKLSILLALCLLLTVFSGCGRSESTPETTPQNTVAETVPAETTPEIREFTDSAGRTVTIPYEITSIAVSGPLSQVYLLPLAGDMLVGVSNSFADSAAVYLPDYVTQLPELGQLYGGKGEMDLEALLAAAPDVVIDVGEAKKAIVEDLDALTEQTGIPFVHIDATVATAPDAYRQLGSLLGREEKAGELASWCESTYNRAAAMMEKVDADNARKTLLYCLGDKGVNVLAEGSFHAETVNMIGKNLAVLEEVVSSGNGNEVDLEQILAWNPEYIIFAPDSCYDEAAALPEWQSLEAISSGHYYETPYGPYGWLSSPPAVQRYLGILWLGALLYPEYVDYDLQEEVTAYYKLFYDCDLTDEMYQSLIQNAI